MEDKYGFLKDNAKFARYLEFKNPEDIDTEVIAYYIRQAIELDRLRFQAAWSINY